MAYANQNVPKNQNFQNIQTRSMRKTKINNFYQ